MTQPTGMHHTQDSEFDELKDQVLVANTAQSVLKHLNDLTLKGQRYATRWIWELMQNARDASQTSSDPLTATVVQSDDSLVFEHNGGSFRPEEIAHLIYHGSTKAENVDAIGKFGSGFITTHLLSPKIDVSGCLTDGWGFRFSLERPRTTVEEMSHSMERAFEEFKRSLSPGSGDSVTRFEYPIANDVVNVVAEGVTQLRNCAPYILIFNHCFSTIRVHASDEATCYTMKSRIPVGSSGHVTRVVVTETSNGTESSEKWYLVAESNDVSVALPIAGTQCEPLGFVPRLFVGFPLITTHDFSFPAVINSTSFKPTENRDGVYLVDDTSGNRDIIREAGRLFIEICKCISSQASTNAYLASTFPRVPTKEWLSSEWLKGYLSSELIPRLRETPTVRTCTDRVLPSCQAIVPFVHGDPDGSSVTKLWQLFHPVQDLREKLVPQEESAGWAGALASWCELGFTQLDELYDGHSLVRCIEDQSGRTNDDHGTIEHLSKPLNEGCDGTLLWLDRCHGFLQSAGFDVDNHVIVPSQDGTLHRLNELYRDDGVDDALKKLARFLKWPLELRDQRMKVLESKLGAGSRNSDYVVNEIIKLVRERSDNADPVIREASVRLFAWIVNQRRWDLLDGYPTYTRGDSPSVARLRSDEPLAPVGAWDDVAREFCDLFPASRILADRFFEVVSEMKTWREMDELGIVRRELLIEREERNERVDPNEALQEGDHHSAEPMRMTDIVWMTKGGDSSIIRRVRTSRPLAYKLWRFLTEYVIASRDCLFTQQAKCECGEIHCYVVADWLRPVRENRWIPMEKGKTGMADARTMAQLLREVGEGREDGWRVLGEPESATCRLLRVIGIAPTDVMKEWNPDEAAELDACIQEVLALIRGDVGRLRKAKELLEEQERMRKMGKHNYQIGAWVEEMVRRCLKDAGFRVERRHEGADLEIAIGDAGRLRVTGRERRWLVEIKATQGNVVRMSQVQAAKAVEEEDGYLLCVVPIEEGPPTDDGIRRDMRFVSDIGSRLEGLVQGARWLERQRGELISQESGGIRLEVESGVRRFRISEPVWKENGFPVGDLEKRLTA